MKHQMGFESGTQQGTTSRKTLIFAYCFKDLRNKKLIGALILEFKKKTLINKSFLIFKF